MKGSLLLLFTATCASLVAWFFWHFAGKNAFDILAIFAMATLFADNIRLRRKLRN